MIASKESLVTAARDVRGTSDCPRPRASVGISGFLRFAWGLSLLLLTSCDTVVPDELTPTAEQWRFAIEEPLGSVQHAYAREFQKLVEERSGGEVSVTIYPYGTLGTSDQITELVDMNVVQFAMASPGHVGKLIPEVQVFLLHFLFSEDEALNNSVLNDDPELRAVFDGLYAEKNLQLLSIWSEGWLVWTTRKLIEEPSDFKGVKFRVMTSPLLMAAYAAYGASATPLPYSEVYSALQLNMIDGQENPVFAIQEMSFYEVTDYMIFPDHAPFITTSVTNKQFFDSLPAARREMLTGVVDDLNDYILTVQQRYNRERLEIIKENKPDIHIVEGLTPEQRAAFRKASQPVHERYVEIAGGKAREILDLLKRRLTPQQPGE